MQISPIDVRKLLTELRLSGLSDAKIGKATQTPGATITRLRNGRHRTTSVDRAIKIANFHRSYFAKKEAAAKVSLVVSRTDQRQKRSRMVGTS